MRPGFFTIPVTAVEFDRPTPTLVFDGSVDWVSRIQVVRYQDNVGQWHAVPAGATIVQEEVPGGPAILYLETPMPEVATDTLMNYRYTVASQEIVGSRELFPLRPLAGLSTTAPVVANAPLEDNSEELREWLNSPDGTKWSRDYHHDHKGRYHALIEDLDDHSPECHCSVGAEEFVWWDNSRFEMQYANDTYIEDWPGVKFDPEAIL